MSEKPYAAVLTHIPSTGQTFHTPFDYGDDPMAEAKWFRDSEEERGDFPGSLWTVVGNGEARRIHKQAQMKALGFDYDEPFR